MPVRNSQNVAAQLPKRRLGCGTVAVIRWHVPEMCSISLSFSQMNSPWIVTEMRLKYSFRKNIQQQFSHHSVTIQDVMKLALINLSFEMLHVPDFSFMGDVYTKAHK